MNVLDIRKIYNHTGWKPAQSFAQALRQTWDWYVKNYPRVPADK